MTKRPEKQKVIFISWSGPQSRAIAEELSRWLPYIFPGINFWLSTEMDRGTKWFSEISQSLETSDFGIICLTPQNLEAQWIHFEAGAISKNASSRVCAYLWRLTSKDVVGPLQQFNHAEADESGTKKLVLTINKAFEVVEPTRVDTVFQRWWPLLAKNLSEISELGEEGTTIQATRSRQLPNRETYIKRFFELIESATNEVLISTSLFNKSNKLAEAEQINEAIGRAAGRDVSVRIMLGVSEERLPGAIELTRRYRADVRFDPAINMSDINWICSDGSRVIVAMRPTDQSGRYLKSETWFELESQILAAQIRQQFLQRWDDLAVRTLPQYLREIVPRIEERRLDAFADNIGLSLDEVKGHRTRRTLLLFLVGRPGSGKTTLAHRIQEHLQAAGLDGAVWLSDLPYIQRIFATVPATGESPRFKGADDKGGFLILDNSVYDEALNNLAEQALLIKDSAGILILEFARHDYRSAIQALFRKGLRANLVVYLDVSVETAVTRNNQRKDRKSGDNHYTAEEEIRGYFGTDDIASLSAGDEEFSVKLARINNENCCDESEKNKALEVIRKLFA